MKKSLIAFLLSINSLLAFADVTELEYSRDSSAPQNSPLIKSPVVEVENKIAELNHEIAIKTNAKRDLNQDMVNLEERKRSYISEIGKNESNINRLQESNRRSSAESAELNAQIDKSREEMSRLESRLISLREEERRCKNNFFYIISCFFTNELNKISDQRSHARNQFNRLENEHIQLQRTVYRNNQDIDRDTNSIGALNKEISSLTSKINEVLSQWKAIDKQIDFLTEEIFRLRTSLNLN